MVSAGSLAMTGSASFELRPPVIVIDSGTCPNTAGISRLWGGSSIGRASQLNVMMEVRPFPAPLCSKENRESRRPGICAIQSGGTSGVIERANPFQVGKSGSLRLLV